MPSDELTHLPSIASRAESRAVETPEVIFSEQEGLAIREDSRCCLFGLFEGNHLIHSGSEDGGTDTYHR